MNYEQIVFIVTACRQDERMFVDHVYFTLHVR